jgi:hypothetical protein
MTNLIISQGFLGTASPLITQGFEQSGEPGAPASPSTSRFEKQLTDMQKISIGKYLGVPGLFECGMDNYECPTRTILKKMET